MSSVRLYNEKTQQNRTRTKTPSSWVCEADQWAQGCDWEVPPSGFAAPGSDAPSLLPTQELQGAWPLKLKPHYPELPPFYFVSKGRKAN